MNSSKKIKNMQNKKENKKNMHKKKLHKIKQTLDYK